MIKELLKFQIEHNLKTLISFDIITNKKIKKKEKDFIFMTYNLKVMIDKKSSNEIRTYRFIKNK